MTSIVTKDLKETTFKIKRLCNQKIQSLLSFGRRDTFCLASLIEVSKLMMNHGIRLLLSQWQNTLLKELQRNLVLVHQMFLMHFVVSVAMLCNSRRSVDFVLLLIWIPKRYNTHNIMRRFTVFKLHRKYSLSILTIYVYRQQNYKFLNSKFLRTEINILIVFF